MEATLYLQFKRAAERFPQHLCLSEEDYHLNYKRTDKLVDDISYSLHTSGVKAGDVVALYTPKSLDGMLVFLALSKLGATCLTLDLAFPPAMIEYVLKDANVNFVVCSKHFPVTTDTAVLKLAHLIKTACGESPIAIDDHTAWLVYSSGTTGRPKGVKLFGSAILHSIYARHQYCPYKPQDKVACNIYFYWEAFRPLFFGAHLVVVGDEVLFSLNNYIAFLQKSAITETLWTPSFAEMVLANATAEQLSKLNSLQRVWLNGEVVSDKLAQDAAKLLPNTQCHNLYSISETFDVSAELIQPKKENNSTCASIGKPLPGVTAWILDEKGQECPVGETGELYLYSHSLADGYLNAEKAQAESFVHISGLYSFALCYRTKDLAYQDESGEIFILGRNDHVVKLRGYNVSLLAIEDTLKKSLAIQNCVVKLEGEQAVSQVLVAALEPRDHDGFIKAFEIDLTTGFSKKLQNFLASVLPSYSIPTQFIIKKSLVLDPYSSKLDRKKVFNSYSDDKLLAIWQDIFSVSEDKLDDNSHFFEMGANSLQAIEYMHRVQKLFNFNLTIEQLHEHPTLAEQRQFLNNFDNQQTKAKIDYANDLSFDLSLNPQSTDIQNLSQANNVFMTGVTGFLGAHWLAECLKNTKANYYCLVRAEDDKQALERVKQAFKHYQLDASLLNERVNIVLGCLSKPYLGLNEAFWQILTEEMDVVLHAASQVNLLYPYARLKDSIVDGGRRMLTLATTHKIKPIMIISSDAVYPQNTTAKGDAFLTDESFEQLTYGYAQAKWVQEALVQKVSQTYELPYLLIRLGNLAPALNSGVVNPNDVNHLLCQTIFNEKKVPENLALEFSAVDAISALLTNANINRQILSLSNNNVIKQAAFKDICQSWSVETVSQSQWQQLLQEKAPELLAIDAAHGHGELVKPSKDIAKQLSLSKQALEKIIHYLANAKLTQKAKA